MTSPRAVPDERPPTGCVRWLLILTGSALIALAGFAFGTFAAELYLERRIGLR